MKAALLMAAAAASLVQPAIPVRAHIDHIVVGIRSLDEGLFLFERISGVRAARGGEHPTRGTENALVSLGNGRYLELIAPRKDAKPSADLERMRSLTDLTVVGWAVNVSDMEAARRALATAGVTLGPDVAGSRITPAGATLQWTTANVSSPPIPAAPFFIRWSSSAPHPSATSPTGCALAGLEAHDPDAADLSRALNAVQVSGVTVRRGDADISVSLKCPKGSVRIVSRADR